MLEQIPEVDEVVVQNEVMYGNILEQIKPDYVIHGDNWLNDPMEVIRDNVIENLAKWGGQLIEVPYTYNEQVKNCLLYTSDAADEEDSVDLGGRRIIKKKNNKQSKRKDNT